MNYRFFAVLAASLLLAPLAGAQDQPEAATQQDAAQAFVDGLKFRDGEVAIADAHARLHLGKEFRYLDQAQARSVLEDFWGNPEDDSVLGMIVPSEGSLADGDSWAVVVTYSEDGYVSDADANAIDYNELLEEMQESTRADNDARREAGYPGIELVGWAEPPSYDAASKKLHWAKELAFEGGDSNTLNYDIRVLGRAGYLNLNAVADVSALPRVKQGMQQLLPMVEFDAGSRYADFNESTDNVAAYGLAALIGGGVAAKTGLIGKLIALVLAAKKIVIPLLIAGVALVSRLFRGKKEAA